MEGNMTQNCFIFNLFCWFNVDLYCRLGIIVKVANWATP